MTYKYSAFPDPLAEFEGNEGIGRRTGDERGR